MRVYARSGWRRRSLIAAFAALTVVAAVSVAGTANAADDGGVSDAPILGTWEVQSLNGANNNPFTPNFGRSGTNYLRIGSPRYADGRSQMVAFALFRLFDIVKPPPIRQFDARLKNGFGVMLDDLLAAGYTLLVFALWTRLTQ